MSQPASVAPPPRPRRTVWISVAVAAALLIAGGVAIFVVANRAGGADGVATPISVRAQVTLESNAAAGIDPFVLDQQLTEVVEFPTDVVAAASSVLNRLTADAPNGLLSAQGDLPSLFGGTPAGNTTLYGGSNEIGACDPDALVGYLTDNPAKAQAWAQVHGLTADGIADYVATLTPVVLVHDTAVTNHGFSDATGATPRQSVLQKGTAVLVDRNGVPAVRCACGNPLLAPAVGNLTDADILGDRWSDFDAGKVLEVGPAPVEVPSFTLIDVTSGAPLDRTAGSDSPGLLVAAGDQGISTSPDGASWTLVRGSPAARLVEYADGKLVAVAVVGEYPDTSSVVYTSDDGTTWQEVAKLPEEIVGLSYDDGWLLAGPGDADVNRDDNAVPLSVYTSDDGTDWSRSETSIPTEWPATSVYPGSFAAGGGVWLVEHGGILGDGPIQQVNRSTDHGASWTELDWTDPASAHLHTKGYGMQWGWTGTGWGAVGSQSEMVGLDQGYISHARGGTSIDGATWTFGPATPDRLGFNALTWDTDRGWLSVGWTGGYPTSDYSYSIYASADLLTWTELGAPGGVTLDVAVIPGTLPEGFAPPTAAPQPTTPATETCEFELGKYGTGPAWAESYGGSTFTCAEMLATWQRYEQWTGPVNGMVQWVDFGDGWICSFSWVPLTMPEYIDGSVGDCYRTDGSGFVVWNGPPGQKLGPDGDPAPYTRTQNPNAGGVPSAGAPTTAAPAPTATAAPTTAGLDGDLGLSVPIVKPACDGTPIVIYASAIDPNRYAADVQAALDAHPGASYLRTDQSCSSLTQALDDGTKIYAVFRAFGSTDDACRELRSVDSAGGAASTRFLDNGTPSTSTFTC